jgi:hypothetical protein
MIFADGFESGNFSAWSAIVDKAGGLSVSSAAALVGANGMAVSIDNRTRVYLPVIVRNSMAKLNDTQQTMCLRDDTPLHESRYRARFYFDPNSISMGSGNTHRILTAQNAGTDVIALDFRRSNSGDYQIQASVSTDAGELINTSWYTISDAPHAIEFDWQAAASPNANNGYLSLWIDNVLQQTQKGIDNDTLRVEEVFLGPLTGTDKATLGVEFFDHFVSHRATSIGP